MTKVDPNYKINFKGEDYSTDLSRTKFCGYKHGHIHLVTAHQNRYVFPLTYCVHTIKKRDASQTLQWPRFKIHLMWPGLCYIQMPLSEMDSVKRKSILSNSNVVIPEYNFALLSGISELS